MAWRPAYLIFLAALAAATAQQTAPPLAIRAETDTAAITVGDPVRLTITVAHAPGATVRWPDSLPAGPFEVLEVERTASAATYTLTAFELGELKIPSVNVTVSLPGGGDTVLATDPVPIAVRSVGRDETGDIRDVKGPLDMPRAWYVVAGWLLAFAAIGAGGYALYRTWRRRPPPAPASAPAAPPRPPHEVAYEALDRLAASGMLERGEVKAHFVAVSDIVREYVAARFGIPAPELATHEVLDGLARGGVSADQCGLFETFLETCDLVKFAKFVPDLERSRRVVQQARELVAATEPPPPPLAAAPPAGAAATASAAATDQGGHASPWDEGGR